MHRGTKLVGRVTFFSVKQYRADPEVVLCRLGCQFPLSLVMRVSVCLCVRRTVAKRGAHFTLMVVGESGLGKTTLM